MNREVSPFDLKVLELVGIAREDRDQFAIEAAQRVLSVRKKATQTEAGKRTVLGNETHALARRMRNLAHLQRIPLVLGRSIIRMEQSAPRGLFAYVSPNPLYATIAGRPWESVITPLLLATTPDTQTLEDGQSVSIHDGFTFATPASFSSFRRVVIEHLVVDDVRDTRRVVDRYEIGPNYRDIDLGYQVRYGTAEAFRENPHAPELLLPVDQYELPLGLIVQARQALKNA